MGHMVEEMARQKGWEILAALSSSDAGELQTLEKADVGGGFFPSGHAGTVGGLHPPHRPHRL